jgi:uncharacterized membrane protein YfcA
MNPITIISLILLGGFSGFLSGFTGINSIGIVLAGLSISQIITDYKSIIGTIIYVLIFPTSIGSLWEFYKSGKINFLIGNILLVSVFLGSYMGSLVVLSNKYKISEKTIKYVSGIFALTMGGYFITSAYYLK